MPRGDKSSYTGKQKRRPGISRKATKRGVPEHEAERRAWATVNKETHGGKKSGSGRGKKEDHSPARKGGRLGGKAAAKRPAAARSRSAKKAAQPASVGQHERSEHGYLRKLRQRLRQVVSGRHEGRDAHIRQFRMRHPCAGPDLQALRDAHRRPRAGERRRLLLLRSLRTKGRRQKLRDLRSWTVDALCPF